jgi:hypothetical protein
MTARACRSARGAVPSAGAATAGVAT